MNKSNNTYQTSAWQLSKSAVSDVYKRNPAATILCTLFFFTYFVANRVAGTLIKPDAVSITLLEIAFFGLSSMVSLTALTIVVANLHKKRISFWQALNHALENFIPYIGYTILLGVVVLLGFLALIVPGIVFALWYGLVLYIRIDEGGSVGEVFVRSKSLVKNREIEFAAVNFLAIVFSLFGLLGPVIPSAIVGRWYQQAKVAKDSNQKLPAVAKSSMVIVVCGLLVGLIAMAAFVAWTGAHAPAN